MIQSDALNCNESRKCFAKANGKCRILKIIPESREYYDGECPFAKEHLNDLPYQLPYNPSAFAAEVNVIQEEIADQELEL